MLSTCGIIKNKDGQPVVAIMGGIGKGMETWNPNTHVVERLWDVTPPQEIGIVQSKMVSLKGGQESLFYGGYLGSDQDDIWRYTSVNNTWKRYSLLFYSITCKKSRMVFR